MRRVVPLVVFLASAAAAFAVTPIMPRHPAPSPDASKIAFSWQGDIWVVSAGGWAAQRITANPAYDHRPLWLPGGQQLAFVSSREGNEDMYIVDLAAGTPRRLTFHEAADVVSGVLGADLVFTSRRHEAHDRMPAVYRIPLTGGTERLACEVLALEAVPSPDGRYLALVRGGTPPQRRHYRGAANRDIWLYEIATGKLEALTSTPWDEDGVSWAGNEALVFRSDNGGPDRNLFRLDLGTRALTQLTRHQGVDVRSPRASENGRLVAYELWDAIWTVPADGSGEPVKLPLDVPADLMQPEIERKTYTDQASEVVPSPDGKQVALVVAGDIFVTARRPKEAASVSAAPTVRVTSTPARERDVAWSPDGKQLVYASDRHGQYDLFAARPAGKPDDSFARATRIEERRLTDTPEDESSPQFSPDGKKLAFVRGRGALLVAKADASDARQLFDHFDAPTFAWSPDGAWLAFSRQDQWANSEVFVVPAQGGAPVNVSQHPGRDTTPVWSPDGRRLYWLSRRHARTMDVWAVYLSRADHERSPEEWLQLFEDEDARKKNDPDKSASAGKDTGRRDDKAKGGDKPKEAPPRPVVIDLEGIHERARLLLALPGDEAGLALSPDSRTVVFTAELDGERDLYKVRWDGKELKRLSTGGTRPSQLAFSKDGKLVFYRSGKGTVGTVDLEGKAGDPVSFAARFDVDRAALRRQVYEEAWRELDRRFYDPTFHGADWKALRERYLPLALGASTREDFEEVQNLLGGELNASHMRFRAAGGEGRSVSTGGLGVELEPAADGRGVVVREVLPGTPAARVDVGLQVGDRVLAVNGRRIGPDVNVFELLADTVKQRVVLQVEGKGGARDLVVSPVAMTEIREARYRQWVRERRAIVEALSGGKLGYIHIQGMDEPSLEEFERDLHAAASGRQGLVIDVRNNGGGWTTDYLMAILSVRRHAWTVPRGADPAVKGYPDAERLPLPAWTRPAVALCDQNSYSNAEIFSWAFQTLGRGKVVGTPTFGAVISTGGAQLVDGSFVRLPGRGWFVAGKGVNQENNGCVPDVVVPQPPQEDLSPDRDTQLAKAVETLVSALPADPADLPW
ncbi:MAG TPA: S41 family peptidase [Thermoanaerobaculaceae bacterium]|nr:S41 family peptidase [Thermoanaerobaculaceae bacterium]HRS14899.1 S41 family peptidase [Thermoanaerobaculaceae bacterium]